VEMPVEQHPRADKDHQRPGEGEPELRSEAENPYGILVHRPVPSAQPTPQAVALYQAHPPVARAPMIFAGLVRGQMRPTCARYQRLRTQIDRPLAPGGLAKPAHVRLARRATGVIAAQFGGACPDRPPSVRRQIAGVAMGSEWDAGDGPPAVLPVAMATAMARASLRALCPGESGSDTGVPTTGGAGTRVASAGSVGAEYGSKRRPVWFWLRQVGADSWSNQWRAAQTVRP